MEILESRLIPIKHLHVNTGQIEGVPKNPRFIKNDRFFKLKASIEADISHLYSNELKVYELKPDYFVVLSGNMRKVACKELGIVEIPCKILPKTWTVEQLCKEVIVSNVSAGEWDMDALANEWSEFDLPEWGVENIDFSVKELEAQEDDYAEPENIQVDVVLGDLIEFECADGRVHRLLCGDSTDSDIVARLLEITSLQG
jgi:hypothetical protein